MPPRPLLPLLLLVFALPVRAQVENYYAFPRSDGVRVYASPSVNARVLDELDLRAVLLLYSNPRDETLEFVQVAPDPGYFDSPSWSVGYVRRPDVRFRTDGAGQVSTIRPLPRTRVYLGLTTNLIEADAVDFRPGTPLAIDEVFGPGGSDALLIGAIGIHYGAPTAPFRPALGVALEFDIGYAPLSSILHLAGLAGPTLGIQLTRGAGVHVSARGGVMWNGAMRGPAEGAPGSSEFALGALGGLGQMTGALTVGTVRQLRIEAGYQYAYVGSWAYTTSESDGLLDPGFEEDPVSMTGPLVRIAFTNPLRFKSRSPSPTSPR